MKPVMWHTLKNGVTALVAMLILCSIGSADAAYIILKNGDKLPVASIRVKRDNSVVVVIKGIQRTYTRDQYIQAVADKPPEFDAAVAQFRAKQYDAAIPVLKKIVLENRHLGWDMKASQVLADIYMAKGDAAEAVKTFEKLFENTESPDAQSQLAYFDALLKTGKYDKLDRKLDVFVREGAREHAAKAQIIRGDVKVAQHQLESAVLDYMRTAILFKSEKKFQPEALYKTAETLDSLRDPRAKAFYRQVVDDYPASPYAGKAKAKL